MSDAGLREKAKAELAATEKAIAELEEKRSRLRTYLEVGEQLAGKANQLGGKKNENRPKVRKGSLIADAAEILKKVQKPLTTSELKDVIITGYPAWEGKKSLQVMIYQALNNRKDIFRKVGKKKYELLTEHYYIDND